MAKDPRDRMPAPPVGEERLTKRGRTLARGNPLFEQVAFTLGLDGELARNILADALRLIGASPQLVSLEEMGALLPELERRLQLLLPNHSQCAARVLQVQKMLMHWPG